MMSKKWACLFPLIFLSASLIFSCYQEKAGSQDTSTESSVVVGCGLSETLSLFKIGDDLNFSVENNVQQTCRAISELKVRDDKIYGLCSLSNSLIVYQRSGLEIVTEHSLGTGKNPISFCFDAHGRIWVSNFLAETVEVYELADKKLELARTFDLSDAFLDSSSRPSGIECSSDGVFAVLENLDEDFLPAGKSAVAIFDHDSISLVGMFEISGHDAIAAEYREDDGLVYITCAGDYEQGEGFVGNGKLIAFDPQSKNELFAINVSGAPFEIKIWKNLAIMGNGKEGKILVVDLDSKSELSPFDIRQGSSDELSYVSALEVTGSEILVAAQFNSDKIFAFRLPDFEQLTDLLVCSGPDALVSVE